MRTNVDQNRNLERPLVVGLLIITIAFAAATIWKRSASGMRLAPPELERVPLKSDQVIAKSELVLGDSAAPIKVIMFGDYECPPCRAEWPKIRAEEEKNQGTLAIYFRHFPLTRIHPNAYRAAITSALYRNDRRFRDVHNALYTGRLDDAGFSALQARYPLTRIANSSKARMIATDLVVEDLNFSIAIGLQGTPSFFAIKNGIVYKLDSIAQLSQLRNRSQ